MIGCHRRQGRPPRDSRLQNIINRTLNYFNFTLSRKVHVQITCYENRRLSSLNFLHDEITSAHEFQYICELEIDEISSYNFQYVFITKCLIVSLMSKR